MGRIMQSDARIAGVIKGALSIMFGLWIVLPWDAFAGRPAFIFMALVMPQLLWGVLFIFVGVGKSIGAIVGNYTLSRIASFSSFSVWGIVAVCFWIGDWQNPICWIGTYLAIQSAHHHSIIRRADYR